MAIYAVVLKQQFDTVQESHTHKRLGKIWVPVRLVNWEPEYYGFWHRLKDAWGVLTGRYNAIDWEIPE